MPGTQNYQEQQNACLDRKDAKLFYKIYFALLEYTNQKYNINKIKIYKKTNLNPHDLIDIINKYWDNKVEITNEFCQINPFKFNDEELKITKDFQKGMRDAFIISKFDLEYTEFVNDDKIYMIKGVNDNIDRVVSYKSLPYICITSIIPFKNVLVYDGILSKIAIKFNGNLEEILKNETNNMMKYYHL